LLGGLNSTFPKKNPPRGLLNNLIRFLIKYLYTSSNRMIFDTSLDEALTVLALSEMIVAGNPRLLANVCMARRKVSTLRYLVSSKCMALVEVKVNKHTYTFSSDSTPCEECEILSGPAKSTPV